MDVQKIEFETKITDILKFIKKMKHIYFLFFILVYSNLTGQKNSMYLNIDLSATQRILYKSNALLLQNEKSEVKDLEIFKLSPSIEISYLFKSSKQKRYRVGLGFSHMRFGSKKYNIPQNIPNITPQYNSIKQVLFFNQLFLSLEANHSINSVLRFFATAKFIKNDKLYKIYSASYDENNQKRFPGVLESDILTNHKLDLAIFWGIEYFPLSNNTTFSLKPYISYYLRPYASTGHYFEYLYFEKKIKGQILGIGISMQYLLKK